MNEQTWRVDQWARATGLSRPKVRTLIKAKKIEARKLGLVVLILTQPDEYLERNP